MLAYGLWLPQLCVQDGASKLWRELAAMAISRQMSNVVCSAGNGDGQVLELDNPGGTSQQGHVHDICMLSHPVRLILW